MGCSSVVIVTIMQGFGPTDQPTSGSAVGPDMSRSRMRSIDRRTGVRLPDSFVRNCAENLGGATAGGFGRPHASGPGARVSFRRPLACRVDAHLSAIRRQITRIIEIVERTLRHLHVTGRIHVGADNPGHLAQVVDVDVLVHDHDGLREHQLTETPHCAHDFPRVSRDTACRSR